MAILLSAKRGDLLAWQGTRELLAGTAESLRNGMAGMGAEEQISLLNAMLERVREESGFEEEFSAGFREAMEALHGADDAEALAPIHVRLNTLAGAYFRRRGSLPALHALCAPYREALVRKALSLSLLRMEREGLGAPPAPYAWLTLGEEGRLEQTPVPALAGLLVHGGTGIECTGYFAEFARLVALSLAKAGMSNPAGIMPGPPWSGSRAELQGWLARKARREEEAPGAPFWGFPSAEWVTERPRQGDDGELSSLVALSDLRLVCGDATLGDDVKAMVRSTLQQNPAVLRKTARIAAAMPAPLNFLGGFRVERSGKQRGLFNLKTMAWRPLVLNVRVLAARHGITETNTPARLKLLLEGGHLSIELAERLLRAYHGITGMKVALALDSGTPYLNPENLSPDEEHILKSGIDALVNLQRIVYQAFAEQG